MKYFAVCDPTKKNVWYVARTATGAGNTLYIIATANENNAREMVATMNQYGKPVEAPVVTAPAKAPEKKAALKRVK